MLICALLCCQLTPPPSRARPGARSGARSGARAMLLRLIALLQLLTRGDLACTRSLLSQEDEGKVFVGEGDANSFLGRHLLFNRFDFEIFVPGNLERECYEEICNFEEAREVFENIPATEDFWKKYTEEKDKRPSRVDVTSLLVGLIAGGVALVIVCLLVWYFCQGKCKTRRANSVRVRPRRSNASLIIRRLEEVSLQPVHPPGPSIPMEEIDPPGLPSYEQAIAKSGQHDAPPPPYPGSRHGSIRR